jgi:mannose-6-phosphate isomerase-like protein (cupin superfamily)
MSPVHLFNANSLDWTTHPTFAAIQIKVLQGRQTHAAASLILVRLAIGGTIEPHVHEQAAETVVVLAGQGWLQHGDQQSALAAGMGATIPPGLRHSLKNTGELPLELIAIHAPAVY